MQDFVTMVPSQAQTNCETILQTVRSSLLNFSCQATPYSVYLTIRKSFAKNMPGELRSASPPQQSSLDTTSSPIDLEKLKGENKHLQAKCEALEEAKNSLVNNYEEEKATNVTLKMELETASKKRIILENKSDSVETNLKKSHLKRRL